MDLPLVSVSPASSQSSHAEHSYRKPENLEMSSFMIAAVHFRSRVTVRPSYLADHIREVRSPQRIARAYFERDRRRRTINGRKIQDLSEAISYHPKIQHSVKVH